MIRALAYDRTMMLVLENLARLGLGLRLRLKRIGKQSQALATCHVLDLSLESTGSEAFLQSERHLYYLPYILYPTLEMRVFSEPFPWACSQMKCEERGIWARRTLGSQGPGINEMSATPRKETRVK